MRSDAARRNSAAVFALTRAARYNRAVAASPRLEMAVTLFTLVLAAIGAFVAVVLVRMARQVADRDNGEAVRRRPPAAVAQFATRRGETAAVMSPVPDPATVAAIGLALALEAAPPSGRVTTGPSPWAMAGRLESLRRRSPGRRA